MIEILYEDDDYMVFNKPAGLLVIPSPRQTTNTLLHLVNRMKQPFGKDSAQTNVVADKRKLYPCHRLDRETSGVILFAKGKRNQKIMMESFRRQEVKKTYIAFVRGRIAPLRGRIALPVKDRYAKATVSAGKKSGHFGQISRPVEKDAVTEYSVLSVLESFSVIQVFPKTGRKNQIRIHFKNIGHPLLGERVYAFRKDFPLHFKRLALHAQTLNWKHPVSRKRINVRAPLPDDMQQFWDKYKT